MPPKQSGSLLELYYSHWAQQESGNVWFNFLGRDFFNALSEKDTERFTQMLIKWLCSLFVGIPVYVLRDYYLSVLSLEWREWMTNEFTTDYFKDRSFYQVQAGNLVDNPDQLIDLVSFSEILYTIYPPLFVVLVVYSVGGTGISIKLGQKLVGLNFQQEAQEANFRYGLVRVRENAESIAFYGGEASEQRLLWQRLSAVIKNYAQLLSTSRNLEFFTSSYRQAELYIPRSLTLAAPILPAAVVAPLYFQGKIGFGVINQSSSAFNHILSDVSLVVYQFESIANFGAVIDRLGEFQETPDGASTLVQNLSVKVKDGESLLVMGPSGVGKTSVLRAIAGLWSTGSGTITRCGQTVAAGQEGDIMFVPQRPYMVLGSLREQVLYPTWATSPNPFSAEDGAHAQSSTDRDATSSGGASADDTNGSAASPSSRSMRAVPSDQEICQVLRQVQLGPLLDRVSSDAGAGLDTSADWASMLSLGEQQRLAFARIIISKPKLVIMDEATSALDTENEELLYKALKQIGVTFVSVGHRPTLTAYHEQQLRLQPVNNDSSPSGIKWEVGPISEAAVSKT
ncbi:MAG: abc transporter family [Trebouxia sp. A1-2]|nr:MAG: abc transporter family [Trebouxia sp. A1-2]